MQAFTPVMQINNVVLNLTYLEISPRLYVNDLKILRLASIPFVLQDFLMPLLSVLVR